MPKEQISTNDYSVKKVHRLQTLIHIRKLPFFRNTGIYQKFATASVSTLIRTPSTSRNTSAHVVMVAPVVSTSSTNKIYFQQNVRIAKMKDAVHILPPFIGRFACLRFRMFLAH